MPNRSGGGATGATVAKPNALAADKSGKSDKRKLLMSGERHNVAFMTALLAGLVAPRFFSLPDKVAEDTVISFLSLRDAMIVRTASTQLRALVEASLARRTVVDISRVSASDEDIVALLNMCPAAETLTLRENIFAGPNFGRALSPNLRRLEIVNCPELRVSSTPSSEEPPMAKILAHCRDLEILISNAMCDRALRALADACGPTLREVSCRESGHHVTGAGVLTLVQASPRLRALDLSWCAMGDEHFQTIAGVPSVRERLQVLDISGCCDVREPSQQRRTYTLTEEGVALGILRMHALRQFACDGLFPEGPLFFALSEHRGFPLDLDPNSTHTGVTLVRSTLSALRFGDCPRLDSGEQLRRFAHAVGPNLRVLELKGCKEISDIGGLCELAKASPRLEEICLSGCIGASNLFMQTLASSCPRLRKAAFRRVERLSDVGVEALVSGCHALEYVDLSGCLGITDRGLEHLMQCTNLQTLLIYCCSAITDHGFLRALGIEASTVELEVAPQAGTEEALSEAATAAATFSLFTDKSAVKAPVAWPRLEHLDLSWCFHISAPCFLAIMQRLPNLRKLSMEGFDHFTSKDLARIQCFGPRVVIEASHHADDAMERHIQHLHRLNVVDDKRSLSGSRLRARSADSTQISPKLAASPATSPTAKRAAGPKKGLRRKGSGDFAHHITLYQPVPHTVGSPRARARNRAASLSSPKHNLALDLLLPPPALPVVDTERRCEIDKTRVLSSPQRIGPNGAHLVRRVSLEDLEAMESPIGPEDLLQARPRAYSEALTGESVPDAKVSLGRASSFRSSSGETFLGESRGETLSRDHGNLCRRRFGDDQQDLSRLSAFAAAK
ncbi:F-box/LRR-repeat protein 2 [Hondaea fermentalgiana]|uniref:F-box/LRR-repeat protein 2 n=1 Tax=Hondaea fermentalgiana TaxID=2315210 RepID=A0A2R5GBJ0_9STRA|nr:F-box/LRR-repeat protein 2 [Hondaea fermentalgiana]|eukprot:GBG28350.1 F-box/LRR-repeat protein 2 [Hondaea fermentalgiana]